MFPKLYYKKNFKPILLYCWQKKHKKYKKKTNYAIRFNNVATLQAVLLPSQLSRKSLEHQKKRSQNQHP